MSFYRDTIRKAKKVHKCELCGSEIAIGEEYHDKAGNGYDFWYQKECEKCQPVIREFMQSDYADDGYCEEVMREWWMDVKCTNCVNYYPPCNPVTGCMPDASILRESTCDECKNGRCQAGDYCNEITHHCRCENYREDNQNGKI